MDIAADERFKSRDARRQNYQALEQTLAPTFKTRTRDEWLEILQVQDVPAAPLYTVAEVLDDPQVNHLALVEKIEHPLAGALRFVGGPVRYDGLEKAPSAPPPLVGEHSRKILQELGYDRDAVSDLQLRGVTKAL